MKHKIMTLLAALLLVISSLSCKLLTPDTQPTEEPDFNFETSTDPLKFEPETLPAAQVGVEYEVEIHITENHTPVGDFSISEGALPAGLELVKLEGEDIAKISGAPQEAGTYVFVIHAWCYGTQVFGQEGAMKYELVVK